MKWKKTIAITLASLAGLTGAYKLAEQDCRMTNLRETRIIENPVIIEDSPQGNTLIYSGVCKNRSRGLKGIGRIQSSDLEIMRNAELKDNLVRLPYLQATYDGYGRMLEAKLHVNGQDVPRYQSLGNGGMRDW